MPFIVHTRIQFCRFFALSWIIHVSRNTCTVRTCVHAVDLSCFLHQESYQQLLRILTGVVARNNSRTVMSKNITLPGVSKHNYISIGIYNHPCNARPKGCKAYPGGKPLPPSECNNRTGLPWGAYTVPSLSYLSLFLSLCAYSLLV